ncbi:MAG: MerR family transcriptional regulator [Actinobacteria bacterium HGW-Actinobacteria-8]|nr:MAG: MerR family transcriptional regulator [Actinobacteria bacterium HGW-Actinobacteria-8]
MSPGGAAQRIDNAEDQAHTEHRQIGDVAERTGLSLRTIRYYEEVALVAPSARSHGGFRLYTEADIARFALVARMRPLGFSLDEMRDLLEALDTTTRIGVGPGERAGAQARVSVFQASVEERVAGLRRQLDAAETLARSLRSEALLSPDVVVTTPEDALAAHYATERVL